MKKTDAGAQNAQRSLRQHKDWYVGRRRTENSGRVISPGAQYLVQMLKSGSFGQDFVQGAGRKALDAGCGSGFNTVTLDLLGWEACGFDISEEIVAQAARNIGDYGASATLRVGENEDIPFEDDTFSLLLSMNVIHYVPTRQGVEASLREYARVLAPGGKLFLTTNHPENWIFKDAERLGPDRVRVHRPEDYRNGLELYVFNTAQDLRDALEPWFEDIVTGFNQFDLLHKQIRNHIVLCTKKGRPGA